MKAYEAGLLSPPPTSLSGSEGPLIYGPSASSLPFPQHSLAEGRDGKNYSPKQTNGYGLKRVFLPFHHPLHSESSGRTRISIFTELQFYRVLVRIRLGLNLQRQWACNGPLSPWRLVAGRVCGCSGGAVGKRSAGWGGQSGEGGRRRAGAQMAWKPPLSVFSVLQHLLPRLKSAKSTGSVSGKQLARLLRETKALQKQVGVVHLGCGSGNSELGYQRDR